MKLIFAGTPVFSEHILAALLASDHHVSLVLTQPDRPAGRGRKLKPSPVKALAETHSIPVLQPVKIDAETLERVAQETPDLIIVVAYGLLLPESFLNIPRFGCLNIHTSLLPRWRGAAPIQRAIEAGDTETGVSLMRMDAGLDTGPVIATTPVSISETDNTATLEQKLNTASIQLLIHWLDHWQRLLDQDGHFEHIQSECNGQPQPESGATYAHKITKSEGMIDWSLPAQTILQKLRAFTPFPGCFSFFSPPPEESSASKEDTHRIKILAAHPIPTPADPNSTPKPGTLTSISKTQFIVATGDTPLAITDVQLPGSKAIRVSDLLNSKAHWFPVGSCFFSTTPEQQKTHS